MMKVDLSDAPLRRRRHHHLRGKQRCYRWDELERFQYAGRQRLRTFPGRAG